MYQINLISRIFSDSDYFREKEIEQTNAPQKKTKGKVSRWKRDYEFRIDDDYNVKSYLKMEK
ncbi:hypothetical protein DERF_014352 [Dermatophagoides farinae]|uniref:Uncharacterized protein n=1 Tax=Dermatophagoides farinae TaxID=6954 RepID=A0A922HMS1_DERFA|nr:hypothetical protein DERF_014352 [Dermatophagoides farinae]